MLTYIVSSVLDYSLLICDDAGPGYAISMGWKYIYLNEFQSVQEGETFIVDNRVQQNEIEKLEMLVLANTGKMFFFKIVDPYLEIYASHYYYQFLTKISRCKNAFLLSVYEPVELTALIKKAFDGRFIHLPYPYIKEKEVNRFQKNNKIIISGALSPAIYPYRYSIWKKVTRSVARIMFAILPHPGYAEFAPSKAFGHVFVGTNYIERLSNFKYMLLCPSRCGLEFLKFNECAYAGCIPVGEAPHSYPPEIKSLFLRLRPDSLLINSIQIIFKSNKGNIVLKYRNFLYAKNNPDTLNDVLKKFILRNTSILRNPNE